MCVKNSKFQFDKGCRRFSSQRRHLIITLGDERVQTLLVYLTVEVLVS